MKVTFMSIFVIQWHWQWRHSIGRVRFPIPISMPVFHS